MGWIPGTSPTGKRKSEGIRRIRGEERAGEGRRGDGME